MLPKNYSFFMQAIPFAGILGNKAKRQGTWIAVAGQTGSKNLRAAQIAGLKVTLDGDKIYFRLKGEDEAATYRLYSTKVGAGARQLPVLDMNTKKGRRLLALYQWRADRLVLCYGEYNQTPPTDFDGSAGFMLLTLKKAAKKKLCTRAQQTPVALAPEPTFLSRFSYAKIVPLLTDHAAAVPHDHREWRH